MDRDEFRAPARSTLVTMAVRPSPTTQEQELLDAARAGDETRLSAHRRGAPGRAPRALLPHARLAARRRGRAPGDAAARVARAARLRRPKLAAHLALPDRDQRLPRRDRASAEARAAGRLRPVGRHPASDVGEPLVESVWIEPYPDEALGVADGLRRAGGALRAARGRRARVHRRAPAPVRRRSAPCSSCARCSASPRARCRSRSTRPSRR